MSVIYRLFNAGRWLAQTGCGLKPADWNREMAASYVAAVDRATIGQWTTGAATPATRIGQPYKAASKASSLTAMRQFFRDCQEWGWIPVRFNPFQVFATPRSVRCLIARSYRPTLPKGYPKTAAILSPDEPTTLEAPYGVPAGTVIAWYPPDDAIYQDEAGTRQIKIPRGWKVADGQQPHPLNLMDRFVRGAASLTDFGQDRGSDTHSHTGSTDEVPRHVWRGAGGGNQDFATVAYRYTFTTQPASNVPAHVSLIYLVKL